MNRRSFLPEIWFSIAVLVIGTLAALIYFTGWWTLVIVAGIGFVISALNYGGEFF